MKLLHRARSVVWLVHFCVMAAIPAYAAPAGDGPRVYGWDAGSLQAARMRLASGDPVLQPALASLRAEADVALTLEPPSVMRKSLIAASGDKHDYFSFAPYWWPDPSKPDGLPYIRRDGDVNPVSRTNTDSQAFGQLGRAIESLSLAYWFTSDERFAVRAAHLARTWFLAPATRMNPNFQHAQAIPGVTSGRGIGIIEARRMAAINDSLALLAGSAAWTPVDQAGIRVWMSEFYLWLTTSRNGMDEQAELNNHGTWYDAQVAHLALVLERPNDAKKTLRDSLGRRIAEQIQPDGSQPRELARTKSLDYSIFNLEALFTCAQLADQVGIEWWGYVTADGRGLRGALSYLAPYVDPATPWPKSDLHEADRSRLVPLLQQYLRYQDDSRLSMLYRQFVDSLPPDARWRLLSTEPRAVSSTLPVSSVTSNEKTPLTLAGSEPFTFRRFENGELRMHIVKPANWSKDDRRPALVAFFGGGWSSGTPAASIGWAAWAASYGMVGIAPDYRTRNRFNSTPEQSIADARAAIRWIAENAHEFGLETRKIVALGSSVGAHLAAWTAIPSPGPGLNDPVPTQFPVALVLVNPVLDTTAGGYGGPRRFGGDERRAIASSVPDQMPLHMPPSLIFHGTADIVVPYVNSVAFCDKLIAHGNRCDLVTLDGLGHSYYSSTKFGAAGDIAQEMTRKRTATFLTELGLFAHFPKSAH